MKMIYCQNKLQKNLNNQYFIKDLFPLTDKIEDYESYQFVMLQHPDKFPALKVLDEIYQEVENMYFIYENDSEKEFAICLMDIIEA